MLLLVFHAQTRTKSNPFLITNHLHEAICNNVQQTEPIVKFKTVTFKGCNFSNLK